MPIRLFIIAAVVLTFSGVARNQFVTWDDYRTIAHNPRLNPSTLGNTLYYWNHSELELYIPLTYTTWSTVAVFARTRVDGTVILKPYPFHLLNLGLHCVCVLIVFELLFILIGQRLPAALGAMVFAVHPLQSEAVAWASGGKDVLSGMLGLLAIWMACQQTRRRNLATASIAFAAALLAKPGATAAIPVAIVLLALAVRCPLKEICKRLTPWIAMAIASILIARHVQPVTPIPADSLFMRPLIAADAMAFYTWKLSWPFNLAPDYARRPMAVVSNGWIAWTWTVPAAVAICVAWVRKRAPLVLTAALVFPAGLMPMLGLVRFNFQRYSTVADHYTYLAMVGPALALAAIVAPRGRNARAVGILLVLALAIRTAHQVSYWRDSETLFAHTVQVSPQAPMAHLNYGSALGQAGKLVPAINEFRIALDLAPGSSLARENLSTAHVNYGAALANRGQLQQAVDEFHTAVLVSPQNAVAQENLARALEQMRNDR